MGFWLGNTTLIYGEGLFSWDMSFCLTVESICSFLLGQIFGQLVGHSRSDWLLIYCSFYPPHMHFVRCFRSCARILVAIFAIWNMWCFGENVSLLFYLMIIHLGPVVHKLWQNMTRQKHGAVLSLETFTDVEKCGADNKLILKSLCLLGYFSCFSCRLLTFQN